jgi:hypothetical protein
VVERTPFAGQKPAPQATSAAAAGVSRR